MSTPAAAPADNLVSALARCQAKFPPIVKSHTNPAFKGSQYADVADVLEAVRPVLAAEGIVVTQVTQVDNETGAVTLITRLMYGPDGEQLSSVFPLFVSGLTDQQVGSKLTYTKRYQLCAILGVHPVGDDDDGNLAATAQPRYNETAGSVAGKPGAPTSVVPDDWQTRPLAEFTFTELRAIAAHLGHSFTGGSKAELIRQLQPLVDALSGEEPWQLPDPDPQKIPESIPLRVEPADVPFEPKVAAGAAREQLVLTGSERKRRDQTTAGLAKDTET